MQKELDDLREKVRIRDEMIASTTIGYLKEVNHMREMIFRKENNEGIIIYSI